MTALLSSKQKLSIVESRKTDVAIWEGAVRSGKTLSSLIAFLDFIRTECLNAPANERVVIIGRTTDTIYRNVVSGIIELLGDDPRDVRYTRGANTAWIFGREVDIIGANDARSESRIRGMTIKAAYVDEATLLPDHGYWEQLLNRTMTVRMARVFTTTNPDNPTHWFKVEVIDRAAELGYRVWHFVLDDNPVLTDEAKAAAIARNRGLYYKRNILGLWVLAEGAIWDMFNADEHVTALRPEMTHWTLGIDYGTAGTFAAQLLAITATDRIEVAAEWRWDAKAQQRQMTDTEYSRSLRNWLDGMPLSMVGARQPERIFVDPSATSFIAQLHADGWTGVRQADNAVDDGLRSVASLLGAGRLRIHKSATGLIGEIPGYVWDPKAAAKGEDAPIKANDHHCDALRYGVMGMRRYWRHWLTADNFAVAA